MGSLCSTSRSVRVPERAGSPGRRGQKTDIRMNPTPPRRHFTEESNFTHKHTRNNQDDTQSLTLANPHAEEKMNNEREQQEKKHYVVEMENQISEVSENATKSNSQPESLEHESAKTEGPNEPSDPNQSEISKIDAETTVNDTVDNQSSIKQPFSPESTVVEVNTPRRDINSLDSQDEEIKVEQPPLPDVNAGNVPNSPEEIGQDMVPKSMGIVVISKSHGKEKSETPEKVGNKPPTPTDDIIPDSTIENKTNATLMGTEDITVSKENNKETELKSQTGATPVKIEETTISPTPDVTPREENIDSTAPLDTQEETIENKEINPNEATQNEPESQTFPETPIENQSNSTPEKIEEATTPTSPEVNSNKPDDVPIPPLAMPEETNDTEDLNSDVLSKDNPNELPNGGAEEEIGSIQPDIANTPESDNKDLPTQDCSEVAKERNGGEIDSEPAKSDTLEKTIIDDTTKDNLESEDKM